MINKLGNSTGNKTYSSSPKGADLRAPFFSSVFRFLGHFLLKMPCRVFCKAFQRRGQDSAGLRPSLSRGRPRGSLPPSAAHDLRSFGLFCRFVLARASSARPNRQKSPAHLRWAAFGGGEDEIRTRGTE